MLKWFLGWILICLICIAIVPFFIQGIKVTACKMVAKEHNINPDICYHKVEFKEWF